jgi:hypothetical protein
MIPSTLMTQTMLMTTDQNEVTIYFLTLSSCHLRERSEGSREAFSPQRARSYTESFSITY